MVTFYSNYSFFFFETTDRLARNKIRTHFWSEPDPHGTKKRRTSLFACTPQSSCVASHQAAAFLTSSAGGSLGRVESPLPPHPAAPSCPCSSLTTVCAHTCCAQDRESLTGWVHECSLPHHPFHYEQPPSPTSASRGSCRTTLPLPPFHRWRN